MAAFAGFNPWEPSFEVACVSHLRLSLWFGFLVVTKTLWLVPCLLSTGEGEELL